MTDDALTPQVDALGDLTPETVRSLEASRALADELDAEFGVPEEGPGFGDALRRLAAGGDERAKALLDMGPARVQVDPDSEFGRSLVRGRNPDHGAIVQAWLEEAMWAAPDKQKAMCDTLRAYCARHGLETPTLPA